MEEGKPASHIATGTRAANASLSPSMVLSPITNACGWLVHSKSNT